jgi:hypothetical protein
MAIAAIVLAVLGIIATALVGWLVHEKTSELLNRMKAILIARATPQEISAMERLIEDIERTGQKRGTIVQRANGTWGVDWDLKLGA